MKLSPSGYIYKAILNIKFREHVIGWGRKTERSRVLESCLFLIRLCHSNIRSYTHKISLAWPQICELNKDDIPPSSCKHEGEKAREASTLQKNKGTKNAGNEREVIFISEELTNCLSSAKSSVLKTYLQKTYGPSRL